jgi:hypothetical protein
MAMRPRPGFAGHTSLTVVSVSPASASRTSLVSTLVVRELAGDGRALRAGDRCCAGASGNGDEVAKDAGGVFADGFGK